MSLWLTRNDKKFATFRNSRSWAFGPPINYEKTGGAGVSPATQSAQVFFEGRLCHQFFTTFQGRGSHGSEDRRVALGIAGGGYHPARYRGHRQCRQSLAVGRWWGGRRHSPGRRSRYPRRVPPLGGLPRG